MPRELSRAARLAFNITLGGFVASACGADAEQTQVPPGPAPDSSTSAPASGPQTPSASAVPTTSVSAGPSATPAPSGSASAGPVEHSQRRVVPIYGASEILILDRIYFETGSSKLSAQHEGILGAVSSVLVGIPPAYLRCVGHALPSEPNHEALAKARAKVVCDRLVKLGIDRKRLTAISEPIDKDQLKDLTKEALERLRATTFQLVGADGGPLPP